MGDPHSYAMTLDSLRVARRDLDRFEGLIETALLDDMRIITSELVALAIERSLTDGSGSIVVTTSLASNVLRIEVDHVISQSPASAYTSAQVIRDLSDRCSDMTEVSFRAWAEIDVHTNGLVTRPLAPV